MVAAGATRVGASAGVKIVQESRGQKPAQAPSVLLIVIVPLGWTTSGSHESAF